MSSKLIDKPLENAEVAAILGQAQKFWIKWRDQVKDKQFDAWEDVMKAMGHAWCGNGRDQHRP